MSVQPALPRWRQDLLIGLLALALVLAWDATGWDLAVAGWYGGSAGFPLREAWLTRAVFHDGGRWLAGAAFFLLLVDALRPHVQGPGRMHRLQWLCMVVVGLLLVPAIKRYSGASCPYDLEVFGGSFPYVPHWLAGVGDGGPARCFPSGHAVAAFAFFPVYFLWRPWRPEAARLALAAVLLAGAAFGWAQIVRGAHFPSHVLWSGWICWMASCAAATALDMREPFLPRPLRSRANVRVRSVSRW